MTGPPEAFRLFAFLIQYTVSQNKIFDVILCELWIIQRPINVLSRFFIPFLTIICRGDFFKPDFAVGYRYK